MVFACNAVVIYFNGTFSSACKTVCTWRTGFAAIVTLLLLVLRVCSEGAMDYERHGKCKGAAQHKYCKRCPEKRRVSLHQALLRAFIELVK